MLRVAAVFLAAMILAGCSSEAAKKPDSVGTTGKALSAKQSSASKSSTSSRDATTSSLEAHRQGKAAGSGPLKDVLFKFDSYDLTPEARSILQANAAWLKANPSANVEIEGHCDERGTTEYNLALGAERARAAMDYLVSLGIAPARIKAISYGEELPICKDATESCYQKNRRDRFVDRRARPTL